MSFTLLGLVLVGVGGWFLLLSGHGRSRSCFARIVEALAVETVVATLLAVALVSFGVFRPMSALILTTLLSLAALVGLDRHRVRQALAGRLISAHELLLVLVLVLLAPFVLPRMQPLRMDHDAGVYSNRAIHHLQTGGLRGRVPVRDRLEGELLAVFDRDNMIGAEPRAADACPSSYLPGTYVFGPDCSRFHFQFFPGWPMLMALAAGIAGISGMFYVGAFVYALAVSLFGLLVEQHVHGRAARVMTLLLFASTPLLLFLSKYTTSEAFLLFLFLCVLHFLGAESWLHAVLAAASVLLFVVSHSSSFIYAPLLLLPVFAACRSADRRLGLFAVLAFGALLAGLPLGLFFSPDYVRGTFGACFGFLPTTDPAAAGLVAIGAFYAVGFAVSLVLARRGTAPTGRLAAWVAMAERLLPAGVPLVLVLLAAGTAWRGYQLGWTDRFVRLSGGAWGLRMDYAGRGWPSLVHLDIVSMVMATSLVGLPVVLGLAVVRGRDACQPRAHAFLLGAVLWSLALFTFFRVDTPFNYYASRYFLPVLVPSTLLLLGGLLGRFSPARATFAVLTLVGLAFNLRYDWAFLRAPSEEGRLRFVREVAARVAPGRLLFVRSDEATFRLLAPLLQSLSEVSVVRVAHLKGQPEMTLVERYAAQLKLSEATVLSTSDPGEGLAPTALEMEDRELAQRHVLYPTEYYQRRRRYYVYDANFTNLAGGEAVTSRP